MSSEMLATSFVSFQHRQYSTMKVVYLFVCCLSVFHRPSSPAIVCAKISSDDIKWHVWCHLWRFRLACSKLQSCTSGDQMTYLLWEEFQALVDQNTLVIENFAIRLQLVGKHYQCHLSICRLAMQRARYSRGFSHYQHNKTIYVRILSICGYIDRASCTHSKNGCVSRTNSTSSVNVA